MIRADSSDEPALSSSPIWLPGPLAEAVVATVRESLLVLDVNLRVLAVNHSFLRTFQVAEAETVGRELADVGNGQWDIPALRTLLDSVMGRDTQFDDFEVTHDFPHLGRRAMFLNGRRIDADAGRPALILLAIEDVTIRREAELRAQAHAAELERSNRELQDFASVASHDLQEPLRKIRSFGDRVAERSHAALDEKASAYLASMLDAAKRMQMLIDDLLSYARITTAAKPFELVELGHVVQGVLRDLQAHIERAGGRVDVGRLPTVRADAAQMRQLFQNLIGNALKFRRVGVPPVVKVMAEPAESGSAFWRIVVEDNGIGFEAKYAAKIFQLFERLHSRSEYDGTGMGLAIVRKIVERHGGTIDALSVPGQGAAFTIVLPVQPPTL